MNYLPPTAIRAAIAARGLSIRKAAKVIGISDRSLRRMLNGDVLSPWSDLDLCRLLGPKLPLGSVARIEAERSLGVAQ